MTVETLIQMSDEFEQHRERSCPNLAQPNLGTVNFPGEDFEAGWFRAELPLIQA